MSEEEVAAEVADGELEKALEEVAEAEAAEEEPAAEEEETPELDPDMQAAIAGAEEEHDEELEAELSGAGVQEHLKEAIQDSIRMKRLLEGDKGDEPPAKRHKITAEHSEMIVKMTTRWALQNDEVVCHVLRGLEFDEVDALNKSGYVPDKFHQIKSACDLLQRHCCEMRERKGIGGGPIDPVSAFKFRWKLEPAADKKLRALTHKELRYVFEQYDGTNDLDELIKESKTYEPEYEVTSSALPQGAGLATIGRFGRLELIDPLADAAVFGDANLTFAVKLVQHRKALGHVGRVIATTFEDLPTLRERYNEIDATIKDLEGDHAEVFHSVDCTRIAVDPKFEGMENSLGAVYYNFPHSGAVGGFFDGHPLVNWRHENLMRLFFRALRSFVKPGGSVKVASNMGAVGVRYSYIVGGAAENEFLHVETIPFLEWTLHRYGRSYGDRRDSYKRPDSKENQSYNAQRKEADMVYCFCYQPSGEKLGSQKVRQPPLLQTLAACADGPFKNLMGNAKTNLANQLHKRFISECSGIHVG